MENRVRRQPISTSNPSRDTTMLNWMNARKSRIVIGLLVFPFFMLGCREPQVSATDRVNEIWPLELLFEKAVREQYLVAYRAKIVNERLPNTDELKEIMEVVAAVHGEFTTYKVAVLSPSQALEAKAYATVGRWKSSRISFGLSAMAYDKQIPIEELEAACKGINWPDENVGAKLFAQYKEMRSK